jgi:hypothetical protein
MANGYDGMPLAADSTYLGAHYETTGLVSTFEKAGLIRTDSMDITNDPRFFNDNVLNYRLAAFSGLSVVSGLMVQNAIDQLFGMSKDMPIFDSKSMLLSIDGCLQLIAFLMLMWILFANFLAVYVGVAQPYHVLRLMTAGPTGFDAAVSYYLNRNIVSWRHLAIKGMLQSIPLYILQMGIRLVVKFDRETSASETLPDNTPEHSVIQGIIFCILMQFLAGLLIFIHYKHFDIFRERYEVMTEMIKPMQGFMAQQMAPRSVAAASGALGLFGFLDV